MFLFFNLVNSENRAQTAKYIQSKPIIEKNSESASIQGMEADLQPRDPQITTRSSTFSFANLIQTEGSKTDDLSDKYTASNHTQIHSQTVSATI